jgi:Tol biopolymer transport system component
VTRRLAALVLAAVALALPATAAAQDSLAPKGAPEFWLPNEEWVNLLWLPYDESRLYALLKMDRGDVFRWVRDDADHTLAQLGARQGYTPHSLAEALIAPRRKEVSARMAGVLVERAERTLTQGHLGQHLLFHSLHQTAIPSHAAEIFGTRDKETFLRLRRAELSPLQICELTGKTRTDAQTGVAKALTDAVHRGVATGSLSRAQAAVMLDRQLRQVPRWLGQTRYNGPSGGGKNRPLPWGDFAKHPTLSADGSLVVWDAYRANIDEAEQRGEIYVRGARLAQGAERFGVSPPGRAGSRRPRSAYNSVLAADGSVVAFESAESTYPLGKRVGQMTVMVRDLRTGKIDKVSQAYRPESASTRTAYNPSISANGRFVAFEATDSGRNGGPSRNALWVVDRSRHRPLMIADDSIGAAYLPKLAGDGSVVAYTSADPRHAGQTWVWLRSLRGGRPELVSRAAGRHGAPPAGDAYDPALSRDGMTVAFVSRASNLGGDGKHAEVYVRDRRSGATTLISGAVRGDASSPSLSANGRYVVFVGRVGRPNGTPASLRSRIWVYDRQTGNTTVVSRATGRGGEVADGWSTEPAISADGSEVVFTSTAGNLDERKPKGLAGVFVRNLQTGTTRMLSTHKRRATPGPPLVLIAGGIAGAALVGGVLGALLLGGRRRRRVTLDTRPTPAR